MSRRSGLLRESLFALLQSSPLRRTLPQTAPSRARKSVLTILLVLAVLPLVCSANSNAQPATLRELALLSNQANIAAIEAMAPPANGDFSLIVVGDSRSGDAVFAKLVTQIDTYIAGHSGPARPLFVLHTGDIVPSGKSSEWEAYARLRSALIVPVVHVRGNHEIAAPGGAANYQRLVGATDWAFDFAGCRFIGVDDSMGRFNRDSVSFLRAQLGLDEGSAARASAGQSVPRRRFVLFHEPPAVGRWMVHAMATDAGGGRGGEVRAAIKEGGVSAVFLGHIHLYDEIDIDVIPYIISGGGGASLDSSVGFGRIEPGFVVVHVSPRKLSWEWVPLAAS